VEGFYVSIIFIGVILVIISLIWIAYDRKKGLDYVQKLEQKKEELVGIIRDAEQMVDELNRFSDYIVTRMDEKSGELFQYMKAAETQIDSMQTSVPAEKTFVRQTEKAAQEESLTDITIMKDQLPLSHAAQEVRDSVPEMDTSTNVFEIGGGFSPARRFREVIKLSEMGLSDTEIAKRLKMGKGEIHLILGTRK
jgi:hypothetical protein